MTRSLDGRRVVVTRPRAQAQGLVDRLVELGAEVTAVPLIEIVPVASSPEIDAALASLDSYAFVVVTSPNGAALLVDALHARARAVPSGVRVVAIGAATAEVLGARSIPVHLVPPRATGAAIVEALPGALAGARVLLPRARGGRPELPAGLRRAGAVVDDVALYDTVPVTPDAGGRAALLAADAVVLTSPSAVDALLAALGEDAVGLQVVTIGPTTSAAARGAGLTVAAEAAEQSAEGAAAALLRLRGA